jgi:hypothetical protein
MKNKTIVWIVLMMVTSLWFGYALGYHNGVKAGWVERELSGHYVVVENGVPQSANYQAEPFPAPKPIKPPPLAQPQSTQ